MGKYNRDNIKMEMTVGVVMSYIAIIVKLVASIIYTPFILRNLGQSQYGVYSLVLSIVGYLTIFDAGSNAAFIRYYVQAKCKNEQETEKINTFFILFFAIIALLGMIVGIISGLNSSVIFGDKIADTEYQLLQQCIYVLSVSVFFEILNCFFNSYVIANQRFIFGKAINLLNSIANPIVTVPFLLLGYNCLVIIIIRLVLAVIMLICNAYYCLHILKLRLNLHKCETKVIISIVQFMFFIVLQSIMDQFNWQIDKFILARTHGTNEISIYTIGTTFNVVYMTISSAVAGVFISAANKLVANKEDEKLNVIFIKTSRLCAYVCWLVMSAYCIFGKQFVIVWAGSEYYESYIIGFLLMFPLTFSLVLGIGQDITRAKNMHQMQVVLDFSVCVINVIVSITLAKKFGALGCAFGTFCAEIILCCIIQPLYYQYKIGIDMRATILNICSMLKGLIVPILVGIALNYFGLIRNSYCSIFIWGIFYLVIYFLSMWRLGISIDEKRLISKTIGKVKNVKKEIQ